MELDTHTDMSPEEQAAKMEAVRQRGIHASDHVFILADEENGLFLSMNVSPDMDGTMTYEIARYNAEKDFDKKHPGWRDDVRLAIYHRAPGQRLMPSIQEMNRLMALGANNSEEAEALAQRGRLN